IGLMIGIVRYQWRSTPPALLAEQSCIIDIERQLGRRPVGVGPYQSLAKFPWNEQFTVEVSEKRLALARLPLAWQGLRILHLSDWHLLPTIESEYFEAVANLVCDEPVDLVVFTGDLIDDMACIEWLPSTLGQLDAPLGRYFILGNHDWVQGAEAIRELVSSHGWRSVGSTVETIEHLGHRMAIAGDETPWLGSRPKIEQTSDVDFRLLLSHTPDHFRWAQQREVDLMLSGHNHGGQVVLPVVGPVYSPSSQGVRYAAGTFEQSSTVMHVSRGLAGRHPLRWRCRPEVTRLILERGSS
ncbi:MAG: metallophosphoesterase, partial [Planctomycetaceae bacterium]